MDALNLASSELIAVLPDLLKENGCISILVTGYSMRPLLRHGQDSVWLRACPEQIRRGQILLYRRLDGKVVLHRVHRLLSGNRYRMNGDAQVWSEIIHRDQILAEVCQLQRGARTIDCSSLGFRVWSCVWALVRPIRPVLFRIAHRIKRLFER